MIGGHDIVIRTGAGLAGLDLCVRIICRRWPRAVFDSAETGTRFTNYAQIPFAQSRELFVYRDHTTSDKWGELGATPETQNTMIHLLLEDGTVTVVVDDPSESGMAGILRDIRLGLCADIFNQTARIKAREAA